MENNQKYALITGATQGIGYELAKLFAKDQYNLIIVARDQQQLDTCSAEFRQQNIEVIPIASDLFSLDGARAVCEVVASKGIFVDVLVNNAGQGVYGKFQDTDLDRELSIVNLNIGATLILTKHFLKEMLTRNEGKILNLASIVSKAPGPWNSVYHGTKAFVLSFSEAIREELKDTNITVTALLPGITDTDFPNKANMNDSKMVQNKEGMADAADVAKDGYEALMAGKDKVISGLKNQLQVQMMNIMPDSAVASMMAKQQEPVKEEQQQSQ
jgi:short-subunit dehydrogenase